MKKSIFTVYVPITEGQEQCNRLKQNCIDNGLLIWDIDFAFEYRENKVFEYDNHAFEFYCSYQKPEQPYQVTEAEFIELLKEYKK